LSNGPAPGGFTALVLAGARSPDDPLARAAGVTFKALAPVAGRPMLARVLDTLAASAGIGRIAVCAPPDADIAALCAAADARIVPAAASPARSVAAALEALGEAAYPILVATADHPLLTPDMVGFFLYEAAAPGADVAVALAARGTIVREYPDAVRTFLRFRDEAYSGCNLFALTGPRAAAAVRFWQRVEAERKRPWRLVRAFGLYPLMLFALGRLTLDRAMEFASRRMGVTASAVRMPFAEAAIDVDKPADRALAERILAGRTSDAV
jgi:GTP:adenosylcobinamide-phosphate guanylyltransferase